ncbi:LamG-like jellyroll fold domain-containing protein [Anatilimnocola floriformis]|uniref:LamG-like jellyroll fold domain-containing protein n=1 Tax=Anatilimnocola floriformis TaxID=2948575 RepID=UPI0020C5ADBC|nr:LamG-like jellyroll fold domain-containing protein [Anatilimnocola floriformis]
MSDGQNQPVNPARERSPHIDQLMKRFVEDRTSLEAEELDQLIEALRAQPALAVEVRSQLILDDLLAQKLAVDRRNFLAQVGQRIGDFENEVQIYTQVSGAVSKVELNESKRRNPGWMVAALGVAAACAALVAVLVQSFLPLLPRQVAEVRNLSGNALVGSRSLHGGDKISTGSMMEVPAGSTLLIEYRDKTTAQFGSASQVTKFELVAERKSRAKQVHLLQGEVLANVAPQRDLGPMVFETPQAKAIVIGTQFRLIVSPETTRLDVTEGKVSFVRTTGDQQASVAANESAVADNQGLVLRELQWPDAPQQLLFSLWGVNNVPLVRNPANKTEELITKLEVRGPAQFVEGVNVYNLNGGSLYSWEAGDDLVENIRQHKAFTIEAIIMPDSNRANDARIFGLGDQSNQASFRMLQRKNEFVFELWTSPNEPPVELKLGKVKADHATHIAVSYDGSTLTGYVQGVEKSRISGLKPGLDWSPGALSIGADANGRRAWRGTVCDLAISDHALDTFAIARSHGQYEALFARRDTGLSWDNLMSDDLEPARYAGKGNWQIVDDSSWQNETVEDSWLGLGPDGLKNYDLLVDLHWVEGDGPLKLTLPVEDRCSIAVLPKSGAEQKTTLQDMGGGPMPGNVSVNEQTLPSNRTARLEVQVRQQKDNASLAVSVDGQPWVSWSGSPSELRDVASDAVPTLKKPTLITAGNVVRIDALKVRDLSRTTASAIGQ